MNDLYIKRNELRSASMNMRSAKFKPEVSKDKVQDIIVKQNELWNKYKFYDEYLKCISSKKLK